MRYGVRQLIMDKWIVMQLVNSLMPSHRGFCNIEGSICYASTGQFWIDKKRHYLARLNRWKCSSIHGFTVGIKIMVIDTASVCEGETQGSAASIFTVKELRSASRRSFSETDMTPKSKRLPCDFEMCCILSTEDNRSGSSLAITTLKSPHFD